MLKKLFLTATIAFTSTVVFSNDPIKHDKKYHKVSNVVQQKQEQLPFSTENEIGCLAMAIYREARGESYRGKVLVGQTVTNRTHDKLYPKTICKVVGQKGTNKKGKLVCQFSWHCMKLPNVNKKQGEESWYLAKKIYYEQIPDISHGALFFFKDNELKYVKSMGIKLVAREGVHGFYVLKG